MGEDAAKKSAKFDFWKFNKSLDHAWWFAGFWTWMISFHQSFEQVSLPTSLQRLTIGGMLQEDLQRLKLLANLQHLCFCRCYNMY